MDKLIPVWDHIQAVFWFWCVWKCLDLVWIHTKCDAIINNLKRLLMPGKNLKDYTNQELIEELRKRQEMLAQFSDEDLQNELDRRRQLKNQVPLHIQSETPAHWPN